MNSILNCKSIDMPKDIRLKTSINYLQGMICKFINKFVNVNNVSIMTCSDLIIAAHKQQEQQGSIERLIIGSAAETKEPLHYLIPDSIPDGKVVVTEAGVQMDYTRQCGDEDDSYSGVVEHGITGASEYHAADWLDLYKRYTPMSKHFVSRSTNNICGIISAEAEKALRRWYTHERTALSIVVWGDVNHPEWYGNSPSVYPLGTQGLHGVLGVNRSRGTNINEAFHKYLRDRIHTIPGTFSLARIEQCTKLWQLIYNSRRLLDTEVEQCLTELGIRKVPAHLLHRQIPIGLPCASNQCCIMVPEMDQVPVNTLHANGYNIKYQIPEWTMVERQLTAKAIRIWATKDTDQAADFGACHYFTNNEENERLTAEQWISYHVLDNTKSPVQVRSMIKRIANGKIPFVAI